MPTTMIRHSNPKTHAAILRKVALRAVEDARAAWKKARKTPGERLTRSAFRACVFAARALRQAAEVHPLEAAPMLEEAERIDAAGTKLKAQLARIVEGADPGPARR